jgi:outer membrane protein OmpA-like peptidoglycan-associated protein/Mg-chelatase subunit ChlD
MCLVLIALLVGGVAFAAGESDLKFSVAKPGATATVDHVIKDGKALVSVEDARKKPILGLTVGDFSVTQSGRKGKVTSVQPFSENQDVPRHIVLVLDNSYSMYERKAIKALLDGVAELLKTVRPIDDVQMVVFDNNNTTKMGGRDLHVQTFGSNQPAELNEFAAKAYSTAGLTGGTVLYEAILAGLELIKKMPATEPRFMVVFSDGQDLNSHYKKEEVFMAAKGVDRFKVYAIDYTEPPKPYKFLTKLAVDNRGQVWKAKSVTNLVPIFQEVASKMLYFYVVSYQFPPTGRLTVTPAELLIDEVKIMGSAAPSTRINVNELTLRPVVDSAYGIARWKAIASNTKGSVAELPGEGAPAAEIKLPLPTSDLQALAANGDLTVRMELEDRIGQNLALTAGSVVKVRFVQTRANLTMAPTGLTIEEIKTIDVSPMLAYIFFAKDGSEILPQYVRFGGPGETAGFDEQKFTGTLEKYYQDLNIIGKRLTDKTEARITLVGCNDNAGKEKGNKKLSTRRAEAVRDYLKTIWNIAPERMTIEVRNLPAKPSTIQLKEGQAENRRVEIVSTDPAILAPIRSTYITTQIDESNLTLQSDVVSPYGVASWRITAANTSGTLADLAGKGEPAKEIRIPLDTRDLKALATGGDITVKMELTDSRGQSMVLSSDPIKIDFIQTSQRLAQKQNLRVREKYALVLFDFDKETIDTPNQNIINTIVTRIKTLPQATVEIVGHTDTIGTEKYNQKLSERRALAVNKLLSAGFGEPLGNRIRYSGVGQDRPLFDNLSPEARTFNRTVTITLEYLSTE